MTPHLRQALLVASLAAAGLAFASPASAGQSHADGSSKTRAEACKLAMSLARQGVPTDRVVSSHCECLENKEEQSTPWSCSAFVSYQ